jgi:hypothetical protein
MLGWCVRLSGLQVVHHQLQQLLALQGNMQGGLWWGWSRGAGVCSSVGVILPPQPS